MVRAMCGVQLKDRKISTDLVVMLDLKETIDQLAMANSVRWDGHVLRREDGHVLMAINIEGESKMNSGRLERTWKKQIEEKSAKVVLKRKDALCRSKWSDAAELR